MFTLNITPRFSETDALGHINNTTLPVWFEEARTPIFRLFVPDLSFQSWNLILKKFEVEFRRELFHGSQVEIRTRISHLGTTSLTVAQEAWQNDRLAATGEAVLIHFDYQARRPATIPESVRSQLRTAGGAIAPADGPGR